MATTTLTFEIGTEELPAFDLHAATKQLSKLAKETLEGIRVPFESIEIFSTPRRLIVIAKGVPETTEETTEVFRGPAARIAFDADGNPTKAALGFARGKGLDASALERREENGVEYVYATKVTPAMDVAALLPDALTSIIKGISWPKSCKWGTTKEYFSRPVRWIVALLGETVVPVSFANIESGNETCGHRFLSPGPHKVAHAEDLIDVLRNAYVVPTEEEREASIRSQVKDIEAKTGLVAELPEKTMSEVVNLAEYPTVMVGEFDEMFLAVPKEITVDAMLVHQRYFPLFNADGSLANKFLITSNGNPEFEENIVDGNQRVVAARLYDAKFFYDEDLKKPLEAYVDGLESVVFQEKLGTTRAKTDRLVKIVDLLSSNDAVSAQEKTDALRAAYLCKADLVTGAVVEFTSVQGIMGCYYAKAAGETDQVAQAIADHYRPRFAGDDLPQSHVGQMVAFADKLDTICGLFAIEQGPTGSSDPFALRRQAIGIVNMLVGGLPVSLDSAIDCALANYAAEGLSFDVAAAKAAIIDFFVTRTKVILKDDGNSADAIDAVLACGVYEPAVIAARVRALTIAREEDRETLDDLAVAYARANNLRNKDNNKDLGIEYAEDLLNDVERNLANAIVAAEGTVAAALDQDNYPEALKDLASLRKPIDAFFDEIMVMDEDMSLRENRLKILNRFVGVFASVADFGILAK